MTRIYDLPPEILDLISHFSELNDVWHLATTCRAMRSLLVGTFADIAIDRTGHLLMNRAAAKGRLNGELGVKYIARRRRQSKVTQQGHTHAGCHLMKDGRLVRFEEDWLPVECAL